jgi:transposase
LRPVTSKNMVSRKECDRIRVIGLAQAGKSVSQIVRETGLERQFVTRWYSRTSTKEQLRKGRPKKVTPKVVQCVKRLMNCRSRQSVRKTASMLSGRGIIDISRETVRRVARQAGLTAYKRPSKPRLTDKQRLARLEFARSHAKYDWRRVFFSDETTIVTHGKPNRQIDRIWATSADQVPPVQTQKYSSYVRFWGGFGYFGKSELVVCDKPFNSDEYIRVLKKGLRNVDFQYDGPWELEQDGDRAHTAVKTLDYLVSRKHPVKVLQAMPSGSPDIWPIENLWPVLKDNIARREPKSKEDLIRIAKQEWKRLDLDFLRTLIDSLPRRLLLVRRANGGPISY